MTACRTTASGRAPMALSWAGRYAVRSAHASSGGMDGFHGAGAHHQAWCWGCASKDAARSPSALLKPGALSKVSPAPSSSACRAASALPYCLQPGEQRLQADPDCDSNDVVSTALLRPLQRLHRRQHLAILPAAMVQSHGYGTSLKCDSKDMVTDAALATANAPSVPSNVRAPPNKQALFRQLLPVACD